jgi:hypothetical protein
MTQHSKPISKSVAMSDASLVTSWYNQNASWEHNRLIDNQLEYSVTMRVILNTLSHFPNDQLLRIADIGGGTGRYGMYKSSHHFHD